MQIQAGWLGVVRLHLVVAVISALSSANIAVAQAPAPQPPLANQSGSPQPPAGYQPFLRLPQTDAAPAAWNANASAGSYIDAMIQPPALNPPANYAPAGMQPRGEQNAPGVPEYGSDYYRYSDPVPEYIYDPGYYDYSYPEVRQVADYAPPGYETRDYQSAPGEPEYTPITPPVRVTQDEREKFVVGGVMPGSFLAPGTNTSVRLRGFVRLAALYDFDPIGLADAFVPNTIPVPQTEGENFNMSGRISRFGIETWTPTDWCERTVHTFIEGDFFNGPAQAAGGGGNAFRLRHAFFDIGWFRFGQQNSVFMDGTAWPSLVDFQGPNSWTNQRQPLARMTVPLRERLFWASSMVCPFTDITTNGLGSAVQDFPDFATHLRFEGDLGHVQTGLLLRSLGFEPNGFDEVERVTGVGLAASTVFHPWAVLLGTDPVHDPYPSGLTRSRILLQATWGPGVGRYINDLPNLGLDAQVDPLTGEFDTVDATGWNASYEHWFNEHWLTSATYSQVTADSNPNQAATTYERGKYLAVSLWWIPVERMSFGIESIWGERQNLDGQSATANRLHGLFQYNF